MTSRYQRDYKMNIGGLTASEPQTKRKDDPWARMLDVVGSVAPAAGTAIGGGIGAALGAGAGGIGALPGAGIGAALGGAAGSGLGALATGGAQAIRQPGVDEENDRLARERERQARQMAALSMLGGIG